MKVIPLDKHRRAEEALVAALLLGIMSTVAAPPASAHGNAAHVERSKLPTPTIPRPAPKK